MMVGNIMSHYIVKVLSIVKVYSANNLATWRAYVFLKTHFLLYFFILFCIS